MEEICDDRYIQGEMMNCGHVKTWNVVGGIVYGAILTVVGVVVAGFGEGTYTLMGLSSAPICLFGVIPALLGPPILWAAIVYCMQRTGVGRNVGLGLLVSHYLGGVTVLVWPDGVFSNWKNFSRMPHSYVTLAALGFGFYIAGQIFVWRRFVFAREKEIGGIPPNS